MHLGCVIMTNVFVIVASSLNSQTSSVVLTGDKVKMNCSVAGSGLTTWTYTSWNASTEREIYSGGDIFDWVKSRYKIDKRISGQHNLIIDSVDLAHAGRYQCSSGIQKTMRADTELIVLGCEPECNTNASLTNGSVIEHSYLWMWCRVNYTGNMIPIFNMTKENAQGDISDYASTTDYYTTPLTTTATVTLSMQLNSDDNGAKIKLRITFQLSNSYEETLPAYTWNYTANVLYGTKNLSIVRFEDRLLCTADGNPNPIYKWTNSEANRSTYGPVHWLNYAMESYGNYTIQCEATNALASERKNISHFQIPNAQQRQMGIIMGPLGITLVIGLPTLALLVGLGVAIAAIARSCSQGKTSIKATSAEPDNQELQNEDTNYSTLNVQPSTTEESSAYCELRLVEKSSADFKNQAREEKPFKSKPAKRKISRGTGSAQLPPLPHQPNRQPSFPPVKLIPTTLSNNKRKESKTTATCEDYCSITHRPSTAEEPQLYCELRLND